MTQAVEEGIDIEFIGPKREEASNIDQETRNLYVRMSQDVGLMQRIKRDNAKVAEIIEFVAENQEEVATRLPDSAAAQAVEDGDVTYDPAVLAAGRVAPVAPAARRAVAVASTTGGVAATTTGGAAATTTGGVAAVTPAAAGDTSVASTTGGVAPTTVAAYHSSTANTTVSDNETEIEALRAEENKKAETIAAAIKEAEEAKRAEEARIVEAARVEALEGAVIQTAVKEDEAIIATIYNPVHNIPRMNSDILFNRMKSTTMSLAAVAAGDEDERMLDKGIWISGTYGVNKQGSQKGFAGYKGHTQGGTIGFDIGFDNYKDLVGIAYTKLDSKFKSSGNKLNTNVESHIVALYGQKELPKNFMIQGMFAYNHNIIKSKINRLGTIASGKYKNNNYNFESLLSYNYVAGNMITVTPNIGIRYGHIKDGTYQESGVGIQHLSIASRKQHLWTGIVGGSVALAPQKITEGLSITPALQGSVENYFNNKSKKLAAKVQWKDREVEQNIALPKQPKVGYNIGASVLTEKGNISVLLEYNCHLQKKYQSHQGFVKLKIKL